MKKITLAIIIVVIIAGYILYQNLQGPRVTPPAGSQPSANISYKDGTYTGPSSDAYYGYVQVKATISGGKISMVTFLDYPRDRSTSQQINRQAMPYLQQEAIQAQSGNVNIISGATDTSQAFRQSLSGALAQAQS